MLKCSPLKAGGDTARVFEHCPFSTAPVQRKGSYRRGIVDARNGWPRIVILAAIVIQNQESEPFHWQYQHSNLPHYLARTIRR